MEKKKKKEEKEKGQNVKVSPHQPRGQSGHAPYSQACLCLGLFEHAFLLWPLHGLLRRHSIALCAADPKILK